MVIDSIDVAVDTDDPEIIIVAFGSGGADPQHYLMLQRSREFDEQDVELGMDGVYIERDDQGYSAYGGITRFELHRDRASIRLNGRTAGRLGVEEIEVRFRLDDEKFEGLRAGLADVFDGYDSFVDLAI